MKIEIDEKYCKLSLQDRQGLTREKLVDVQDLLNEFSTYQATNFGLLPRGTRVLEKRGDSTFLGIEFPKSKRLIKFKPSGSAEVEEIEGVSLPAGIMFITLRGSDNRSYRYVSGQMYAVAGDRIMFKNEDLYRYPTPNIYEDGRICWGYVEFDEFPFLSSVEGMVSSFFTNKFNTDLFYNKLSNNFTGIEERGVGEYFKYLSENEFQTSWLIKDVHASVEQKITHFLR